MGEARIICQAAYEECEEQHRKSECEASIIDLAIKAEDDRIKNEIERRIYRCGYGEAKEEIKEERYKRSKQEHNERQAMSKSREEAEKGDDATRRCMTSALAALRELNDASSRKSTLHVGSFALTDLKVQKAAAINRRKREDMAAGAAAKEERPTGSTMGSGSSGSQDTGGSALTAKAISEKNEEDKARAEAADARDKKKGEAAPGEGYASHRTSCGKKGHTKNQCPFKHTYRIEKPKANSVSEEEKREGNGRRNVHEHRDEDGGERQERKRCAGCGRPAHSLPDGHCPLLETAVNEQHAPDDEGREGHSTSNALPTFELAKEMRGSIKQQ